MEDQSRDITLLDTHLRKDLCSIGWKMNQKPIEKMCIQPQEGQGRAAAGTRWDVNIWSIEESCCYPPRAVWTR